MFGTLQNLQRITTKVSSHQPVPGSHYKRHLEPQDQHTRSLQEQRSLCTEPRVIGDNFIFTRVRRKGPAPAGSADKTVNLNYYCAQFGAGNNFVPIGSSTLSFSPSETDKTTSGIHWSLPTGSSNHVCLGVEISTDKDPLIGTTLDQHIPGWNTGTDLLSLMIITGRSAIRIYT